MSRVRQNTLPLPGRPPAGGNLASSGTRHGRRSLRKSSPANSGTKRRKSRGSFTSGLHLLVIFFMILAGAGVYVGLQASSPKKTFFRGGPGKGPVGKNAAGAPATGSQKNGSKNSGKHEKAVKSAKRGGQPSGGARAVKLPSGPLPLPEESIPEDQLVYVAEGGRLKPARLDDIEKLGYTVINLSDDWTPFIFSETTEAPNGYRNTFISVANDRTDERGRPLEDGQHNYVELFGIPPSMSVVARRFRQDAKRECYSHVNYDLFKRTRVSVTYSGTRLNLGKKLRDARARLKKAKGHEKKVLKKRIRILQTRIALISEAQKRLKCEGLLEHYKPGVITWSTARAIRDFEHKHMIFGWGLIAGDTKKGFARTPLENNFRTLRRVLMARVADGAGILEDGSVAGVKGLSDTYTDMQGKKQRVPDLVHGFTDMLMRQMGIDTPEKALAFFKATDPTRFRRLRVAVRFPELPPYYSDDMDFGVRIDRGDVWYDYPYDAQGRRIPQPVYRRPRFYLYVRWNGQEIPLVRWGTTIGGWRKEWHDGKMYMAYKESDVGPRVWLDIMAAPVWVPPKSTPPRALVRTVRDRSGRWVTRPNYEEVGPSYASAYGLVAAYHVKPVRKGGRTYYLDNGIRTHGSVDYMSIMRRHSHGCHRLHNHLAVRLFSFVLRHRAHVRKGQLPLSYGRKFEWKGKRYSIELHTRGYDFRLVKPIPVMVEKGRILGKLQEPIRGYMPVPGEKYEPDDPYLHPEARARLAGGAGPKGQDDEDDLERLSPDELPPPPPGK